MKTFLVGMIALSVAAFPLALSSLMAAQVLVVAGGSVLAAVGNNS